MDFFEIKKNKLIISRAGTGIYLILKANEFEGKRVLVPANICYAAIYPIIYAGAIPVFCDVDEKTGNITRALFQKYIDNIDAAIVPHMYGNPVADIEAIQKMCQDNSILLIEDCASAMGASINEKMCGTWGDYSIFSTGYSKTLDFGGGGIIMSNWDLSLLENIYSTLPEFDDQIEIEDAFFSKLYRLIRNNDDSIFLPELIWNSFRDNLSKLYLYQDHRFDKKISDLEKELVDVVDKRRVKYKTYEKSIKSRDNVYEFEEGSVPWRFCMLVPEARRKNIIEKLLEEQIPVSDWYPVVTPIFGEDKKLYPKALKIEKQIINFPLLIDDDEIYRICDCINKMLEMEI